jgi:hypothetical protein
MTTTTTTMAVTAAAAVRRVTYLLLRHVDKVERWIPDVWSEDWRLEVRRVT